MKPWIFISVSLALASISEAGPKKKMRKIGLSNLEANLTALWTKVNRMGTGVQIHLHGMGDAEPHMDNQADGTHVHLHMHMGRDDHRGHDKHMERDTHENEYHYGICQVETNTALTQEDQQPITGNIYFRQMHGEHLEIKVHLEGFDMSEEHVSHLHGLHVHQYGDMSDSCNSLGSHFNPDNNEHGGPHKENRHCGDYGNVECDEEGVVHRTFHDDHTSLEGRYSILGRSIVIHEEADDLSSEVDPSGGAGKRLACCVVVGSKDLDWDTIHGDHEAMVVVEDHRHEDMSRSHHKHGGLEQHNEHKSNDDTHHRYDHSNDDTNHGYHDKADDKGHEHENHPDHPATHEGHVHPDEHDPNHEGHADHVGHAHEDHPDHPGHKKHMGHDHPDELDKGDKRRGGKGKRKGKRNKQS